MVSFDVFWTEVLNGKTKVRFFNRGDVKFRETFSLLYDNNNQPFKVISVAVPETNVKFVFDDETQQNANAVVSKAVVDEPSTNSEVQKF